MIEAVVFDLGNTLFTATAAGYRDDRWERRLGLAPGPSPVKSGVRRWNGRR